MKTHEVHGSVCPFMAKAELGLRRITKANSGARACPTVSRVEALHGMCMSNHGRGRIRTAALHALCNQRCYEELKDALLATETNDTRGQHTKIYSTTRGGVAIRN